MKTMREITDWTAWTHRLRLAIVVLFVPGAVAQTHYSVQDLGTLLGPNSWIDWGGSALWRIGALTRN